MLPGGPMIDQLASSCTNRSRDKLLLMNGTRDSAAQYSAVRLHGISPRYRFTARNAFISARVVAAHLYCTPHTHPTSECSYQGSWASVSHS